MTRSSVFRHTFVAALIVTLSACGSSDSDNGEPSEILNADTPSSGEETVAESPVVIDDDPVVTENENTESEIPEGENTGEEITEVGITGEEPADPSDENPADPTVQTDEPEPADAQDTAGLLIPPVAPGSDLERVVQGLTRQAASTLLDLNQRISQGETLTAQQEQCLGAYEEGFGEPLMAVNCAQPLATDDVELWVGEAAFHDTPACRDALSSQGSEGCVLERMTLTIRTYWVESANGDGPPAPAFPGASLAYGIDEPVLTMQNADSALTGFFSCNVNLETAAIFSAAGSQDCNQRVESIADEIERLQNFSR